MYGANTLGAVCGAAVATFFALEEFGTRATLWAGCAINLLVGAIAYLQSKREPTMSSQNEASSDDRPNAVDAVESSGSSPADYPRLAYFTAALLGFTFFTMELVWYRMLAPILGGTTFTFGLILCVALFGIGIGGAAYTLIFRRLQPSWSILAITCAAEALAAAVPFALGDRIAPLAARLALDITTFGQLVYGWAIVAAIVVLPAAIISGLQFPLLIALLGQGRQGISRQLGLAYAWNTLGAIAGSLVAGFGVLPLLTAPGTWRAVVLLLAACSVVDRLAIARREPAICGCSRDDVVSVHSLHVCSRPDGGVAARCHRARRSGITAWDPNSLQQWLLTRRPDAVVGSGGC